MTETHAEQLRATRDGCLSNFRIDQQLAGLLAVEERSDVEAHLQTCGGCREKFERLSAKKREFDEREIPEFSVAQQAAPVRRFAPAVAAVFAVAASVLLFVNGTDPAEPLVSTKGGDSFGYFVVAADGSVRGDERSAVAQGGDQLQWRVKTSEPRYVLVLSVDPAGLVSRYYPVQLEHQTPVEAEQWRTLPVATELDATVGDETLYALTCTTPPNAVTVQKELERLGQISDAPASCTLHKLLLEKRRPQ